VNSLLNILWLGLKEIRSLLSDVVMVVFVIYAFTLAIYVQATGTSSEVNNASIAFVDEDGSALSKELLNDVRGQGILRVGQGGGFLEG
jgi:ABC-2 type transport system permease protein